MTGKGFAFERTVYWIGIVCLGVPFLAVWISAANLPVPTGNSPDLGALEPYVIFCFSGTLSISLAINQGIFARSYQAWGRPLPRSVAIGQALLLALIAAWLISLQVYVTMDPRPGEMLAITWWEALGIVILSIFVCARANYLFTVSKSESEPESWVPSWD